MVTEREQILSEAEAAVRKIETELFPQYWAAYEAWKDEGFEHACHEHIVYARAQSWIAWATGEAYFDVAIAALKALADHEGRLTGRNFYTLI
jgi:hypothetical protein